MTRADRPLISVVFSFRNEADNIPTLVSRLEKMFGGVQADYEVIFVNDASTDASLSLLVAERQRNPRITVVNMSRRFGVAEGVIAGMATSRGDAVVYMDADLQDPPEVIPALIDRWRQGADVVHTVRTRRHGENPLKMAATRLAYRLIQFGSSIELPVDAGDFKLLSRPAVDHLLRLRESDPYLRGLVVWLGFNQVCVPYERDSRHAGRTHFPFFSRNPWKTFTTGLTSFSFMPIYVCFGLAAAGLAAALLLALAGSTLMAALTFFWATTIGAIAVIGTYLIRVYKDVRGRPPYIIESVIGDEGTALVLVNPGSRARIYQSLGKRLTAVENPVWAGLIATFVRAQGFSVEIVDAEADELSPEQAADRVKDLSPVLAAIVVYGHQPSASTQNMTGASALATAIKNAGPDIPLLMVGGHVASLPERTLADEACDFVSSDEGLHTIVDLLNALEASPKPDLSRVRGLVYRAEGRVVRNDAAAACRQSRRRDAGRRVGSSADDALSRP